MVAVASLRWVTPGAATEGVTPLFFPKQTWRLFLLIAVTITIAFFLAFYCFHSDVTPCMVGCHLFYLSDLVVSPLFFVNLPTKKIVPSGVTPCGVSPGAVRTPPRTSLVMPLPGRPTVAPLVITDALDCPPMERQICNGAE